MVSFPTTRPCIYSTILYTLSYPTDLCLTLTYPYLPCLSALASMYALLPFSAFLLSSTTCALSSLTGLGWGLGACVFFHSDLGQYFHSPPLTIVFATSSFTLRISCVSPAPFFTVFILIPPLLRLPAYPTPFRLSLRLHVFIMQILYYILIICQVLSVFSLPP